MSLLEKLKAPKGTYADKKTDNKLSDLGISGVLTIYKGGTDDHTGESSWTLDKKVAEDDSYEPHNTWEHYIYTAKVRTDDVIAYDNRHGEHEIIVHSDDLMELDLEIDLYY